MAKRELKSYADVTSINFYGILLSYPSILGTLNG